LSQKKEGFLLLLIAFVEPLSLSLASSLRDSALLGWNGSYKKIVAG